jgi:hypothetical protein
LTSSLLCVIIENMITFDDEKITIDREDFLGFLYTLEVSGHYIHKLKEANIGLGTDLVLTENFLEKAEEVRQYFGDSLYRGQG